MAGNKKGRNGSLGAALLPPMQAVLYYICYSGKAVMFVHNTQTAFRSLKENNL